jgi:Flp pilus assembly protein TadD
MSKSKQKRQVQASGSSHIRKYQIVIFVFAFVLYGNTLTHDYAQDDAIVITDNMFTTEGFAGIPGLLTKDTFFGFFKEEGKAKLVSGGRYRPLSPIMFAVGWQFFGKNPFIGHLWNVVLYGFIGILLFGLFQEFKLDPKTKVPVIALAASILFLAHPIHTEVVANIKGRDEILALLGAIISLYAVFQSRNKLSNSLRWLAISGIAMFLGCMSKENTITFLAIIPLSLWFFNKATILEAVKATVPALMGAIGFLIIRTMILGMDLGGAPNELMNNPFLKVVNGQYVPFDTAEFMATVTFTLGKYIQLLFVPHPLTHDYYPRHIDIMSFGDVSVWLALVMNIVLLVLALLGLKKKRVYSYGILFYFITMSIVSNIVFPIGTNMSERFLFMPSIGFSIVISYLLLTKIENKSIAYGIIGIVVLLFTVKTIHRNGAWKNDFTLFNTDKHISKNSAKINNAVAGSLSSAAFKEENPTIKKRQLDEAVVRADKAISIHPNYKNAYLIKGNALHYLDRYKEAEVSYDKALNIDPGYEDAIKNSALNYRALGRQYGEKENNIPKAIEYLKRAQAVLTEDYEVLRLLGTAHGFMGKHAESINYFTKALALEPNLAGAHVNLGKAYINGGDKEKGDYYITKALELDPNALQ